LPIYAAETSETSSLLPYYYDSPVHRLVPRHKHAGASHHHK
jgi:hypothetical protein